MSLSLEDFGKQYILTLNGQMTHRVELGKDARGNLQRIDNVLNSMSSRLQNVKSRLDSLRAQMEAAKAELEKPFPQEEELRVKSARLAELNIELNIDDRSPMEALAAEASEEPVAKREKPSILAKLRTPLPERDKPKQKTNEREEL